MQHTRHLFAASMTTLGALALVGATFVGTAGATGSQGEATGKGAAAGKGAATAEHRSADGASQAGATEDDDHNDGGTPNNVADDADNAHPSGKDRSVEQGTSGNQGKAGSDPDDDGRGPDRSNGGPDQPDGAGGVDKADQDGNNGCGNDDDFEDDNEGWCGRNPEKARAAAGDEPATAQREEPATARRGKAATAQRGQHVTEWKHVTESTPTTKSTPATKSRHAAESTHGTCPAGMTRTDAEGAADGCVATDTTCPVAMLDAEGAAHGCVTPAVLGTGIEVCPGGTVMAGGCDVRAAAAASASGGEVLASGEEQAPEGGRVRAASVGGAAALEDGPSLVQAAVGGVAGTLPFTGGGVSALLLVALVALVAGGAMRWADRRRTA